MEIFCTCIALFSLMKRNYRWISQTSTLMEMKLLENSGVRDIESKIQSKGNEFWFE